MESLFEFLFKYRPIVYQHGHFELAASRAVVIAVAIATIAAFPIALTYAWVRADSRRRDRILLGFARVALFAVLGFCLMRPSLSVATLLEQRNYLAVLIDDSRSMRVRDEDGKTRGQAASAAFAPNSELRRKLEAQFNVRYFRFSDRAQSANPDSLRYAGGSSDIGGALDHALDNLSGLPLAGMIVVSDGADNAQRDWAESLLPMRGAQIPVFTVALGKESGEADVQVSRVAIPASVLQDATVLADVELYHPGFDGRDVRVEIEDAGRLLARTNVRLTRGNNVTHVTLAFPAHETGPRQLRVRAVPLDGEKQLQNNERPALLDVRSRREKILMIEGEPRFEAKFIRQALKDEKSLQLVVMQRMAPKKFMRFDVDAASELADGFPTSRAELFAYRGLVLGSIESSFFTHDQLQMVADFVSVRGGGLLMLGGPNSFSEGGWAGTPVADALPFTLERAGGPRKFIPVHAHATETGLLHPVVRIDSTDEATRMRWQGLPQLSTANVAGSLKPGATALLVADSDSSVVLAYQRFGRGLGVAFTPQDSWLLQMHHDVPVGDQTHEIFWRQLLRYLVQDVPEPVRVTAPAVARVQQPIQFAALAEDSAFVRMPDVQMTARITDPAGATRTVPISRSADGSPEFGGTVSVTQPGLHEISVEATRGGAVVGSSSTFVGVSGGDAEFFDAQARPATLQRIADETGGRAYKVSNVASLADDIRLLGHGASATERKDLWDMPAIFLVLLILACAEWLYRRRKGLV